MNSERRTERLQQELEAQAQLGRMAAEGMPTRELSQHAVECVAEVLDVPLAAVHRLQADRASFRMEAGVGWPHEVRKKARLAVNQSHAGHALASPVPVVVTDMDAEDRFVPSRWLVEQGIKSGIACRIIGGGDSLGVLSAHARSRRAFEDGDAEFLEAVANVVGASLARERAAALERQVRQWARLEAVGQLAGGIAHDFNNLLMIVDGYAGLLVNQLREGEDPAESIAAINEAVRQGRVLTRQLLAVGRDSGEEEPIEVGEAVTRCIGLLGPAVRGKVSLRAEIEDGLPSAPVREADLAQILINLVLNARDAIEGTGEVIVKARRAENSGVLIEVQDDGPGMTPEVREQIFEPFFTTKDAENGTGLGLPTVKRIVDESEGSIEIETEAGVGTLFRVELPALDEGEAPQPAIGLGAGAARSLVLVEGDERLRRLTRIVLETGGYSVTAFGSAEEALTDGESALAEADLLLTDIALPGMPGPELASVVHASRPDLEIVFLVGPSTPSDDLPPPASGRVVHKPFSAAELLEAVRERTRRADGSGESSAGSG